MHVAANHHARPDAGVLANRDVANNHGGRIDIRRRGNLRPAATIASNHSPTSALLNNLARFNAIPTPTKALLVPERRPCKHANVAHAKFADKKRATLQKVS